MRFMIIVKATKDADEANVMPDEASLTSMENYHEQLAKAGVLLDRSGLQGSKKGWRIQYDGDKRNIIDGPFAETKDSSRVTRSSRYARAKRRWNGHDDSPIPRLIMAAPRLKCDKCLSRKISIS